MFKGANMNPKFVVNVSHDALLVAFVNSASIHSVADTDYSHFSFLATCNPLDFADVLDRLLSNRDNRDKYNKTDYEQLGNGFDRIYFTRNCYTLSINRGGCSNMFMGSIDLLRKLPELIRKEYSNI